MALYFWRNRKGASRKQWERSEWWFCNNTAFLCPRWALRFCEIPFIVLQKFHASRKYEQCGFSLPDLLMELEKRCWCCPCLIDDTMYMLVWAGALELLRGCAPKSCKWLLLVSPLYSFLSISIGLLLFACCVCLFMSLHFIFWVNHSDMHSSTCWKVTMPNLWVGKYLQAIYGID
jgi:hypothetical protein